MTNKFYANIELGGLNTQVSFEAKDASDVIEQIWRTYGISTPIIQIWEEANTDANTNK